MCSITHHDGHLHCHIAWWFVHWPWPSSIMSSSKTKRRGKKVWTSILNQILIHHLTTANEQTRFAKRPQPVSPPRYDAGWCGCRISTGSSTTYIPLTCYWDWILPWSDTHHEPHLSPLRIRGIVCWTQRLFSLPDRRAVCHCGDSSQQLYPDRKSVV